MKYQPASTIRITKRNYESIQKIVILLKQQNKRWSASRVINFALDEFFNKPTDRALLSAEYFVQYDKELEDGEA